MKRFTLLFLALVLVLAAAPSVRAEVYMIDNQLIETFEAIPRSSMPHGIVSFRFDDGYNNPGARSYLRWYKMRGEYFPTLSLVDSEGYMSWEQLKRLPIGWHGFDHLSPLELGYDGLIEDNLRCRQALADHGITMTRGFSPPFGEYDVEVIQRMRDEGIIDYSCQAFRDGPALNQKVNFNPNEIVAVSIQQDTPLWMVRRLAEIAQDKHLCLVLVFHKISRYPIIGNPYDLHLWKFKKIVDDVNWRVENRGVRVLTLTNAVKVMKRYWH